MKDKDIFLSFALSLCINTILLFVNYFYYLRNKNLLLAFELRGGEISIKYGFGLILRHIYSMLPNSDNISLSFSLINLLVSILLVAIIIYLLIKIIHRIKH